MANIGTTTLYIAVPSLPRGEFEEYSTRIFDEWERYVQSTLKLPDYSLALDVEEGSIKASGRLVVTLGALYIGIGQYGSFVSGLETINRQVRTAGDYLVDQAVAPFKSENVKPTVRKRGESLANLRNLFLKIENGEMSVSEAMEEAEAIFGAEAEEAPEFMNELKLSFEKMPLLPEQIELDLDYAEPIVTVKERSQARSTQSRAKPPRHQFRVEVWRETKNGKRNVRVVDL